MLTQVDYSFLEVKLLRVHKCPLWRGSRVQLLETVSTEDYVFKIFNFYYFYLAATTQIETFEKRPQMFQTSKAHYPKPQP